MRGKAGRGGQNLARRGITPAYAGKSAARQKFTAAVEGSPPRMRGKATATTGNDNRMWITPAYAGKSKTGMPRSCGVPDHPRVCGEKKPPGVLHSGGLGSPPRMRGKEIMRNWNEG